MKYSLFAFYSQLSSSGLISPSEIPESPLQSSSLATDIETKKPYNDNVVFDDFNSLSDQINCYRLEDTPRRSSRTSLSNISFEEEPLNLSFENCKILDSKIPTKHHQPLNIISDINSDNDEFDNYENLLERTVNIGMQRSSKINEVKEARHTDHEVLLENIILDGIHVMTQKDSKHNEKQKNLPRLPINTSSVINSQQTSSCTPILPIDCKTTYKKTYSETIDYIDELMNKDEMNQSLSSIESSSSVEDNTLLEQLVQRGIDEVTKDPDLKSMHFGHKPNVILRNDNIDVKSIESYTHCVIDNKLTNGITSLELLSDAKHIENDVRLLSTSKYFNGAVHVSKLYIKNIVRKTKCSSFRNPKIVMLPRLKFLVNVLNKKGTF